MSTKVISTILTLKDNMSGGLIKASKNIKGMSKEAQTASKSMISLAKNFKKSADEMIGKSVKLGAAAAAALGGLAVCSSGRRTVPLTVWRRKPLTISG